MTDTNHFKTLLENELKTLEAELKTVGRKNPSVKGDWEATNTEDVDEADDGDVAEKIESYEDNRAIVEQLEIQLQAVKSALKKIEDGTYGICEVGGEKIEDDRLEAIPSATTCKQHMQ